MIHLVRRHIVPTAYGLLPPRMASDAATAMLLAIGLQESTFQYRRQIQGPARGFWQFEAGGVAGVLAHRATREPMLAVAERLRYHTVDVAALHPALEHNDVLACAVARLLLWTLPNALPGPSEAEDGWRQYLAAWRPGKPHHETWARHFAAAWSAVDGIAEHQE